MLIQQSIQTLVGVIKDIPVPLLAGLDIGQRLEAVALTSVLANELVKLKVADNLLEVKTPIPIQKGQLVTLELKRSLDGKLVLKVVPATERGQFTVKNHVTSGPVTNTKPAASINAANKVNGSVPQATLKVGQQFAVEVIKQLAENRVLVTTQLQQVNQNLKTANTPAVSHKAAIPLPQQLDVDISQLNKPLKPQDRALIEIVSLKPLTVQVNLELTTLQREQIVLEQVKQLLPQQRAQRQQNLSTLSKAQYIQSLPETVISQVTHLLSHVLDKSAILQPELFKQAIQNSGVFLERQLLTNSQQNTQDFKANLQRLIVSLQTAIADPKINVQASSPLKLDIKSLPPKIQAALTAITQATEDLSKIPAHVRATLASTGVTPTQLLTCLLAHITSQSNTPVQTSELAQASQAALNQLIQHSAAKTIDQSMIQSRTIAVEVALLKELLREAEGTYTKLQFNQLSMLKDPDSPVSSTVWLIDVPLKDKQRIEMLHMRIEQHKHNPHEEEGDIWEIELGLDTENLGPLQASITLHEQDVKVLLKAQWPESAVLLKDNLLDLEHRLADLGVNVSHISCRCEEIKASPNSYSYIKSINSLVDISV